MYLGIDVGGTKIQMAVYDGVDVRVLPKVPTPDNYEELLKLIRDAAPGEFVKVGIGVPGTYTREKLTWVPNIPYLEGRGFARDLERLMGAEVVLVNDAQLALLGEVWQGAARGKQDAVLMSVGTGIGGAIMVEGKLIRGRRGAAGALGWLNLDHNHVADRNHGFLELHASGTALEGKHPTLTSYEVVERAKKGDRECLEIMAGIGRLIGVAFASVASVLDTEILIVSGGLGSEFDLFKDAMFGHFNKYAAPGIGEIPIVKSQLGSLSGVYGAIYLTLMK